MSVVFDNNLAAFLNETTEIEQRITDAKANIARIQEFQGQILNSTSSSAVNSATKERENFISSTRNLLIECKDRVKRIQYENARIPPSDPNFGIRQQRYEYLRTKLSNVLEDYRQVESEFMKQTKDRMARQYIVVNPNATQQEIDDYTSNPDSDPIFQHALLKSTEAKNALAEVQKRHEDIKNIENTIAELADLFQELHLQVEAQDQTIIDIEHNAETVAEKTEQAVGQLGKANLLAKAARKKKWICFGIFILIVIIIVVVIITQLPQIRGDNSQSNNTNKTVTPALINSPSSPSLT